MNFELQWCKGESQQLVVTLITLVCCVGGAVSV